MSHDEIKYYDAHYDQTIAEILNQPFVRGLNTVEYKGPHRDFDNIVVMKDLKDALLELSEALIEEKETDKVLVSMRFQMPEYD